MSKLDHLSRMLIDSLHLSHPPVAIAFVEAVPEGVPSFQGSVPGGCRFWQEASSRIFATVASDHRFCSVGAFTHQLEMTESTQTNLQDALKIFNGLGYLRPEDMDFIPVLRRPAKVVVYGPLASVPVAPDV